MYVQLIKLTEIYKNEDKTIQKHYVLGLRSPKEITY